MPSVNSPAPGQAAGGLAGQRGSSGARADAARRRRRQRAGRKFMPGEPMKWPTKVWAGRWNRSSAVPTCTALPRDITTTWSAKVSASVWSWVT